MRRLRDSPERRGALQYRRRGDGPADDPDEQCRRERSMSDMPERRDPGARPDLQPATENRGHSPSPPPPNKSARCATSTAFERVRPASEPTARAVASAPAALIPNPWPMGSSCIRRTVSAPDAPGAIRRATSSEMGRGLAESATTRTRERRPGEKRASAHTPSSRTTPAPTDPRARGSRCDASGRNTPVTWPGANARATRTGGADIDLAPGFQLEVLISGPAV